MKKLMLLFVLLFGLKSGATCPQSIWDCVIAVPSQAFNIKPAGNTAWAHKTVSFNNRPAIVLAENWGYPATQTYWSTVKFIFPCGNITTSAGWCSSAEVNDLTSANFPDDTLATIEAVAAFGKLHVFYSDAAGKVVRYTFWTPDVNAPFGGYWSNPTTFFGASYLTTYYPARPIAATFNPSDNKVHVFSAEPSGGARKAFRHITISSNGVVSAAATEYVASSDITSIAVSVDADNVMRTILAVAGSSVPVLATYSPTVSISTLGASHSINYKNIYGRVPGSSVVSVVDNNSKYTFYGYVGPYTTTTGAAQYFGLAQKTTYYWAWNDTIQPNATASAPQPVNHLTGAGFWPEPSMLTLTAYQDAIGVTKVYYGFIDITGHLKEFNISPSSLSPSTVLDFGTIPYASWGGLSSIYDSVSGYRMYTYVDTSGGINIYAVLGTVR